MKELFRINLAIMFSLLVALSAAFAKNSNSAAALMSQYYECHSELHNMNLFAESSQGGFMREDSYYQKTSYRLDGFDGLFSMLSPQGEEVLGFNENGRGVLIMTSHDLKLVFAKNCYQGPPAQCERCRDSLFCTSFIHRDSPKYLTYVDEPLMMEFSDKLPINEMVEYPEPSNTEVFELLDPMISNRVSKILLMNLDQAKRNLKNSPTPSHSYPESCDQVETQLLKFLK